MIASIKTPILFAVVILIFSHGAVCQSADSTVRIKRYHVNYLSISAITATCGVADYFAIQWIRSKPEITDAELLALNTDGINSIDRWALRLECFVRPMPWG
jgi:hypothetical protein